MDAEILVEDLEQVDLLSLESEFVEFDETEEAFEVESVVPVAGSDSDQDQTDAESSFPVVQVVQGSEELSSDEKELLSKIFAELHELNLKFPEMELEVESEEAVLLSDVESESEPETEDLLFNAVTDIYASQQALNDNLVSFSNNITLFFTVLVCLLGVLVGAFFVKAFFERIN